METYLNTFPSIMIWIQDISIHFYFCWIRVQAFCQQGVYVTQNVEILFRFFFCFFKTDRNLLLLFSHVKLSSFFEHHECIKQISLGINQLTTDFYLVKHQRSGTNKHRTHWEWKAQSIVLIQCVVHIIIKKLVNSIINWNVTEFSYNAKKGPIQIKIYRKNKPILLLLLIRQKIDSNS